MEIEINNIIRVVNRYEYDDEYFKFLNMSRGFMILK